MDHVAIMRKSWGLTDKILSGEKRIEARWYSAKFSPWDKITKGDMVYFKNSGEQARIKSEVSKVLQFAGLNSKKVKEILYKYRKADGIENNKLSKFYVRFKNKKYCILIFLGNPVEIKPFEINKTGFGTMSAWITIKKISKIKK